jgi:hypothetical protein
MKRISASTRLVGALVGALVATLAVATLGCTAPASAATGHKDDKLGDAPSIVDIAGFTVRNDIDRVVITADVPGLRTRGGFNFEYSSSRYGGFYVFARKNGPGPSVQALYCGEIRCDDVRCTGLRVHWSTSRHEVQVVIPQRCYPDPLPDPGVFTVWSGAKSDSDEAGSLRVARG